MCKPFTVLNCEDEKLKNFFIDSKGCWVLVETHPNGDVARVIAWDGGAPEDQSLVRDFSWVPDILNEYYSNYKIEIENLENEIKKIKEKYEY